MTDSTVPRPDDAAHASPPGSPLPVETHVPSWKLLLTLGGAGALVGLVIVLLYAWTLPRVLAYKAGVLRAAIAEVLHDPARTDTLWLVGGVLGERRPEGEPAKAGEEERVFLGYDAAGTPLGFAIVTRENGFAEPIELIFGYDASARRVLGLKILVSKETPGIADKVIQPVFTGQFAGRDAPLTGVKPDRAAGAGSGAVAMITGATISSRAVIRGINKAITHWQPLLDAYVARGGKS